jgi:predicted Zn-dependent protease
MLNLICALLCLAAPAGQANIAPTATAIDWAFARMYNCDFAGAHAILEEQIRKHPDDPLVYSVRAAAFLYSEFQRLKILEADFFANDDKITDRKRLKPDPAVRAELFKMTGEARKRAGARLAVAPEDRDAMFAMCMASGVETDYTSLVEKKYIRSYSLSKETQQYARKLLALNPPCYDAYLTLGSAEYVVGNLNFFFRLFIRFDQIEGNKQKAIEELRRVVDNGRYFSPFAKILLSVIYLRENQPQKALVLLREMERDFPENPLFRQEILRITGKMGRDQPPANSAR